MQMNLSKKMTGTTGFVAGVLTMIGTDTIDPKHHGLALILCSVVAVAWVVVQGSIDHGKTQASGDDGQN